MERLFTPKEIVEQVTEFEFASLRHLNTRREMGIISSAKASEKRGQKNRYDLKTALIYCILTELEARDFTIEQAAYFAKILILNEFCYRKNIYLVILYGKYNETIKQSYLGFYKNSYKSVEDIHNARKRLEKQYNTKFDKEIIINPLPNVYFKFFSSELDEYESFLTEITGIKTLEMCSILDKYIEKFKVTEDEISILTHDALMNYDNPLNERAAFGEAAGKC